MPEPELPRGLLAEHAYLVARQVRALAVAGWCAADPHVMLRVATVVEAATMEQVVAFVVDHRDGQATYGYAANAAVLDLYEWANTDQAVPFAQRERINGLLLGYSPAALTAYEAARSGRRFATA